MPSYRLSEAARRDLNEVARYTLHNWGKTRSELLVTKYRFHYLFYLTDGLDKPGIIGVIHDRRNIVKLLNDRLS